MVDVGVQARKVQEAAEKVQEAAEQFGFHYRKNLITALSAGLAFLIGFYVKDVLTEIVNHILESLGLSERTGLIYKAGVMFIVVGLAVFGIVLLSRWGEKEKSPRDGKGHSQSSGKMSHKK